MRELLRTNDIVLVSFVTALLDDAGIDHHVADRNFSVVEGSIGIFPHRILVADDDHGAARRTLHAAGLGAELTDVGDEAGDKHDT